MVRTTRIKTYSPGDIVSATDLNAIQDHIVDTANVVNRLATLSNAESIWVDRTFAEGSADFAPVTHKRFVKLQAGGQRGRLMLPGVPEGLSLERVVIRGYIPANDVAFSLWQTIASATEGLTIQHSDSQVVGWPTFTTSGSGWGTIELTGPPVSHQPYAALWVLVENLHEVNEWNSLLLNSVQGLWN